MEYQVSGVLALPGALGTGDLVGGKCIHTLAAEYRVAVEAGQRVGHILLIPDAIAAVLRLAVYRIPRKAVNLLPHKRYIVTAGAAACRHGRSHTAHLSIASVHTVALKYQRLVVVHLRPKRGGFIYRHVHTLTTMIVDAQDGWHMARSICPEVPEHIHPHMMRHTRAMHLYQSGMPMVLLSQYLGHAQVETTMIYAHADTEMKRAAIQKADAVRKIKPALNEIWEDDENIILQLSGLR